MKEKYISQKDAVDILLLRDKQLTGIYGDLGGAAKGAARLMASLPAADVRPAPDRERIDEYLAHIKANQSVHASAESVVAINYWIGKLYEEIYGEEEPW